MKNAMWKNSAQKRRYFIGGWDARIIMGADEEALLWLWREKRGEIEPEDLSGNLVVQLGVATEEFNRRWYETNPGKSDHGHPTAKFTSGALGWRQPSMAGWTQGAVFEVKFMLPW